MNLLVLNRRSGKTSLLTRLLADGWVLHQDGEQKALIDPQGGVHDPEHFTAQDLEYYTDGE